MTILWRGEGIKDERLTEALCCMETAASVSVLSGLINVCEAAERQRDELCCLDC